MSEKREIKRDRGKERERERRRKGEGEGERNLPREHGLMVFLT